MVVAIYDINLASEIARILREYRIYSFHMGELVLDSWVQGIYVVTPGQKVPADAMIAIRNATSRVRGPLQAKVLFFSKEDQLGGK